MATRTTFIEQLVAAHKLTSAEIARFASDTFGYPLLDLSAFEEAHLQKSAIDRKLIAAHRVIPLHKRGNRLSVAIADPTNLRALDEIRFQTGMAVDPVVVDEKLIAPMVAKLSETAEETLKNITNEDINLDFDEDDGSDKPDDTGAPMSTTLPSSNSSRRCSSTRSMTALRYSLRALRKDLPHQVPV